MARAVGAAACAHPGSSRASFWRHTLQTLTHHADHARIASLPLHERAHTCKHTCTYARAHVHTHTQVLNPSSHGHPHMLRGSLPSPCTHIHTPVSALPPTPLWRTHACVCALRRQESAASSPLAPALLPPARFPPTAPPIPGHLPLPALILPELCAAILRANAAAASGAASGPGSPAVSGRGAAGVPVSPQVGRAKGKQRRPAATGVERLASLQAVHALVSAMGMPVGRLGGLQSQCKSFALCSHS